ncbi:hypothetical protein [Sphingobacterium sp. MYb382]|uniref:hypothetical protein n=1 Tax=Sphingobacterium sp. MYb382 TaxID=2745278 RepID=UPI0030EECF16
MKKVCNLILSFAVITVMMFCSFSLFASNDIDDMDGGVFTCYSTYEDGSTNFTNCRECSSARGSNLRDPGQCDN